MPFVNAPKVEYRPAPPGDFVLPFDLPRAGVRGRLVRLDAVSDRALKAHVLPEAAARIAAEACVLATLLGAALKLSGRLTIQTKSDGPLDLVTTDYYGAETERPAGIRCFARLDEARFANLNTLAPAFVQLMGEGVVAITIEPKRGGQTYQGIVPLAPEGIAASAEAYFAQSEQLPTALRLAAAPLFVSGDPSPRWRAGGVMLQATPEHASMSTIGSGSRCSWPRWKISSWWIPLWRRNRCCGGCSTKTKSASIPPRRSFSIAAARRSASPRYCAPIRPTNGQDWPTSDGIIRARCEFCGAVHEIRPGDLAPAD